MSGFIHTSPDLLGLMLHHMTQLLSLISSVRSCVGLMSFPSKLNITVRVWRLFVSRTVLLFPEVKSCVNVQFLFSHINVFKCVQRINVYISRQMSDAPWLCIYFHTHSQKQLQRWQLYPPTPSPWPLPYHWIEVLPSIPTRCPRHGLTASASWWMWPNGPFSAWWGLRSSLRYGKLVCLGRLLTRPSTSPVMMRWEVKGQMG